MGSIVQDLASRVETGAEKHPEALRVGIQVHCCQNTLYPAFFGLLLEVLKVYASSLTGDQGLGVKDIRR